MIGLAERGEAQVPVAHGKARHVGPDLPGDLGRRKGRRRLRRRLFLRHCSATSAAIGRGRWAGGFSTKGLRPSTTESLAPPPSRSEEHTSELQSLMRLSYAVFCLKKKKHKTEQYINSLQRKNKEAINN